MCMMNDRNYRLPLQLVLALQWFPAHCLCFPALLLVDKINNQLL